MYLNEHNFTVEFTDEENLLDSELLSDTQDKAVSNTSFLKSAVRFLDNATKTYGLTAKYDAKQALNSLFPTIKSLKEYYPQVYNHFKKTLTKINKSYGPNTRLKVISTKTDNPYAIDVNKHGHHLDPEYTYTLEPESISHDKVIPLFKSTTATVDKEDMLSIIDTALATTEY